MKKNKTLLFTINNKGHDKSNPDLLRIILHGDFTKIDFGYITKKNMSMAVGFELHPKPTLK